MKRAVIIAIVLVTISVIFRIALLIGDTLPFNSDEAVVGLMAKHILEGERPIYFYGQAYMGSLDAYLVAIGFHFFGVNIWVIRLVQLLLYIAIIWSTAILAYLLFRSKKGTLFTLALMVFPTINFTLYSSVSLGGYGEALLIGNLILITGVLIICNDQIDFKVPLQNYSSLYFYALGILVGLGLWVNGLTMVYSIPVVLIILYNINKNQHIAGKNSATRLIFTIFLLLLGVVIGALPVWIYMKKYGLDQQILEFFGSAVSIENGPIFVRTFKHFISFAIFALPVIIGFRPPWEVRWMIIPAMPFVLAFWMAVFIFWIRQLFKDTLSQLRFGILMSVLVILTFGFLFTSFGIDPSGRYFLPFSIILAITGGQFINKMINKASIQIMLISIVGLYNFFGTLDCALRNPPGLTTQFDPVSIIDHSKMDELIDFLRNEGEYYGYTNYWVSYPLAFQSDETIIYVPALPYHEDMRYTARDDRYPPYREKINKATQVAYITTRNPQLNLSLESQFNEMEVTYKTKSIGNYYIYYDLSSPVRPREY
jgi:4-amino-4-deoxy-L-arabinose transferase-like glycosyltransferase